MRCIWRRVESPPPPASEEQDTSFLRFSNAQVAAQLLREQAAIEAPAAKRPGEGGGADEPDSSRARLDDEGEGEQTQLATGAVERALDAAEALAVDPEAVEAELASAMAELERLLDYPLGDAAADVRAAIDALRARQEAIAETEPPSGFAEEEDEDEQVVNATEELLLSSEDEDELGADDVEYPEGSLGESIRESQSQAEPGSAQASQIEDAYEIKALLARYARIENGTRAVFYLVSWQGFGQAADSWEPRSSLLSTDALRAYEAARGPLSPDYDGLKVVRFRSAERGWRVSVETPAAGSDRARVAVWLTDAQLTPAARALVDAYGARRSGAGEPRRPSAAGRPDGDDDESDDDDDDGAGDDPAGAPAPPPDARGKFLVWSPNSSDFHVSITRTIRDGDFDPASPRLRAAMREYVVTRVWLLLCVAPKSLPDDASLRKIATTYFSIEEAAFKSGWKATVGGPTYAQHEAAEVEGIKQRMARRWTRLIRIVGEERATLRSYLHALNRIEAEAADPQTRTADDPADPVANSIVAEYRAGGRWHGRMSLPVARTSRQNSLVRYRSAETKRQLGHLRAQWFGWSGRRTDAQRRADTLGSCFTGTRPTSWREPSVTSADHVVAQSYFSNTELVGIWSRVRDDILNVLPLPVTENSKKGSAPIAYLSIDPDEPAPDHAVFDPTTLEKGGDDVWTERRQAVSARRVLYTFLSYGLVTEQHDAHSGLADQGAGCGYYARPRVFEHLLRIVRDNPAAQHEWEANRLLLYATGCWCPLAENANLLSVGEFAADFRALLKARVEGDTQLPWLCGLAIRDAVFGFPGA